LARGRRHVSQAVLEVDEGRDQTVAPGLIWDTRGPGHCHEDMLKRMSNPYQLGEYVRVRRSLIPPSPPSEGMRPFEGPRTTCGHSPRTTYSLFPAFTEPGCRSLWKFPAWGLGWPLSKSRRPITPASRLNPPRMVGRLFFGGRQAAYPRRSEYETKMLLYVDYSAEPFPA